MNRPLKASSTVGCIGASMGAKEETLPGQRIILHVWIFLTVQSISGVEGLVLLLLQAPRV